MIYIAVALLGNNTAFIYQNYFSGAENFLCLKTEIHKGARLGGNGPVISPFPYDKGRVAVPVPCRVYTVFIQQKQRAGARYLLKHLFYAVNNSIAG